MMRLLPALLLALAAGPAAAAPAAPAAPDGQALYRRNCAVCHAQGSPGALTLAKRLGPERALLDRRTDLDPAYIRFVVRRGLRVMPWITAIELPDRDLDAVATYLTRDNPRPQARP